MENNDMRHNYNIHVFFTRQRRVYQLVFDKSTKIIECSKQKEMPLLKYAARAILLPT